MSGLFRHNESYEHKDVSRHAEKVIKSQIVNQVIYFEDIPNYLKCHVSNKVIPNRIKNSFGIYPIDFKAYLFHCAFINKTKETILKHDPIFQSQDCLDFWITTHFFSREFPCSLHWWERIWIWRQQLSPCDPRLHVPGWWLYKPQWHWWQKHLWKQIPWWELQAHAHWSRYELTPCWIH